MAGELFEPEVVERVCWVVACLEGRDGGGCPDGKVGYLSFLTVFSRHKKAFNIFKRLEILKVLIAETIRSIVSCLINLFLGFGALTRTLPVRARRKPSFYQWC